MNLRLRGCWLPSFLWDLRPQLLGCQVSKDAIQWPQHKRTKCIIGTMINPVNWRLVNSFGNIRDRDLLIEYQHIRSPRIRYYWENKKRKIQKNGVCLQCINSKMSAYIIQQTRDHKDLILGPLKCIKHSLSEVELSFFHTKNEWYDYSNCLWLDNFLHFLHLKHQSSAMPSILAISFPNAKIERMISSFHINLQPISGPLQCKFSIYSNLNILATENTKHKSLLYHHPFPTHWNRNQHSPASNIFLQS